MDSTKSRAAPPEGPDPRNWCGTIGAISKPFVVTRDHGAEAPALASAAQPPFSLLLLRDLRIAAICPSAAISGAVAARLVRSSPLFHHERMQFVS
jgi:hypothetical protein